MSAPYNGIATDISIQRETALGADSTQPVYSLAGKVKVSQGVEFVGKDKQVNVWREQSGTYHVGKFFSGSIELELGLNAVVEILLNSFFELESQSAIEGGIYGEGGIIFGEGEAITGESATIVSYVLRPLRLKGLKSFKIGLDFIGQSVLFEGVVIDSIRFDIRRNQVHKLSVAFKALTREAVDTPALAGAQSIEVRRTHHTSAEILLDAVALSNLTEASLTFNNLKLPASFGADKKPTIFRIEPFTMTGQLVEYFSPAAKLPDAILDQNEHALKLVLSDPDGGSRKIEVNWSKLNFTEGLPDATGREDLMSRASFAGMADTARAAEDTKLILIA